jgi:hypothetical protein
MSTKGVKKLFQRATKAKIELKIKTEVLTANYPITLLEKPTQKDSGEKSQE